MAKFASIPAFTSLDPPSVCDRFEAISDRTAWRLLAIHGGLFHLQWIRLKYQMLRIASVSPSLAAICWKRPHAVVDCFTNIEAHRLQVCDFMQIPITAALVDA
jgi:hypothetical protein